jgi:methionine-rich copper-binding protein CopC
MRYLRLVLAALAIGAWAAGPLVGAAAAALLAPSYQSSEPSKGEMMDHPPSEVRVTFSEPLDQSSWMNVLDECGNEIDAGPATVELNEMTVGIGKTPSGTYEVVYKATGLAGATGSSTSSFEFMVHHGKPCGGGKKNHHHDDKKKHPNKHDEHDDDEDHDGHDDDGTSGHSGHSGMTGMPGSTDHSGHDMGSMDHDTTGQGGGHGRHAKHPRDPGPRAEDDTPTLAGGTGDAPVTADAQAALVGLALALLVGVLGGWLLRMSGPTAST